MSKGIRFKHVLTGEVQYVKLHPHTGSLNVVVSNMILKYFVRDGSTVSLCEAEKFLLVKAAAAKEAAIALSQWKNIREAAARRQVMTPVSYKKVLAVIGSGEKTTEEGVVKDE